jgi:hypothetical protein
VETTPGQGSDGAAGRAADFRDEIAGMGIKTPVDADERRWLIAGLVLVVVGLVLIIAGYIGASGTVNVGLQMPYLISGGFLGLAVVVVGVGLFVRYSLSRYLRFWLVRSIMEERALADRQIEALERLGDRITESSSVNQF